MMYDGYESEGAKVWLSVTELETLAFTVQTYALGQRLRDEFREAYEAVLREMGAERAHTR